MKSTRLEIKIRDASCGAGNAPLPAPFGHGSAPIRPDEEARRKPTGDGAAKVVLIVDDDRVVRVTIASGLRDQGYEVVDAESGEEALTIASSRHIDIALLDIRMGGMSGIDLSEQLRARTGIPVVFLTAHRENELVRRAVEQGALGYLVKPLDVAQIVPSLEAALSRAAEFKGLRDTQERLSSELSGARDVSVATGVIMERKGVGRTEAFDLLRGHARSQRRKLRDVAAEVVLASETSNLTR
jgi:response regulator NasT